MARRLALMVLYFTGVALFFECSARAFLFVDPLFERVLGDDESSYRLNWIRRGHKPGLSYVFDVYHPVRGWALAPNLKELRVFGGKTLNSSSKGTRGREEHDYARAPGRLRVLVFGDSFTFGEEVSDEETYAAVLEQRLPGSEVINCGVHGYGHDQMLLYLEEEGPRYRPDVVILGFVAFDMDRNLLKFRDFAKPRFDLKGGELVLKDNPVPTPEEVLSAEPYRSKFIDLCSMLLERSVFPTSHRRWAKRRLTEALLDAFRKAGAHVHDSVAADVERAADLGEAPALPQFERDLGAGARTGALVAQVDEGLQAGAVQLAEHDLVAGQDGRPL